MKIIAWGTLITTHLWILSEKLNAVKKKYANTMEIITRNDQNWKQIKSYDNQRVEEIASSQLTGHGISVESEF